jgi:hypothetical protein
MRKILFSLAIVFGLICSSIAQNNPTINVTFFGSSVCKGSGAINNEGYGWQFFHSGATDTTKYKYFNASTGGDNTLKVEKQDRMTVKLYPTNPDVVVIGLSLANEGIMHARNKNGREQILEQFRSRLLAMSDSFNRKGIKPVIVNCYAQSNFTEIDYKYTQRMNRIINTWDYPSINVLGTIDDGLGKWVAGYARDAGHPNTDGHKEMSYSIVPSLLDALMLGKKTPSYDWNKSFTTLVNEKQIKNPLSMEVENTMHSFTLSFRFKKTENGNIAGFVSNGLKQTIDIEGHTIRYKELSASYPKHLKTWTQVVLAHSYTNRQTVLYINGERVGTVKEQLAPTQICFGGTVANIELKDLALHRSCLNESEIIDLYNKKFIQSSLEFYNPLTSVISGTELGNHAQSLTTFKIDKAIKLENNFVPLYK